MLLLKGFHSIVLLLYYRLWWPYLSKRNGKNNRIAERIALLDLASGIISIITPLTILNNNTIVTIMCRNDELSCTISWVGCLLKKSKLFILFAENSQILLKISVIPILLTFMYLVALNLSVNNQLNSSSKSNHHCGT